MAFMKDEIWKWICMSVISPGSRCFKIGTLLYHDLELYHCLNVLYKIRPYLGTSVQLNEIGE